MTADEWIKLSQVVVAALGIFGMLASYRQKLSSDNRTEWYRRYAQSTEWTFREEAEAKLIGWVNLRDLGFSSLITSTEVALARALALGEEGQDNDR